MFCAPKPFCQISKGTVLWMDRAGFWCKTLGFRVPHGLWSVCKRIWRFSHFAVFKYDVEKMTPAGKSAHTFCNIKQDMAAIEGFH